MDFIANVYAIKTIHTLHMDMLKEYFNCNKHDFARHKCFHKPLPKILVKKLKGLVQLL
jgi:hypothetical protein